MIKIFWYATTISSLLTGDEEMVVRHYLTKPEQEVYRSFKTRKRQMEWLAGRITVKKLYCRILNNGITPGDLIIAREDTGAPYLVAGDIRVPGRVSISHSVGWAVVSLTESDIRIGIDLEEISPREPAFITDYFTPTEQEFIRGSQPSTLEFRANLLWSAKESVLKAISTGLGEDPLRVEIDGLNSTVRDDGWTGVRARARFGTSPSHWNVFYRNRTKTVLTMCVHETAEDIQILEVDFSEDDQRG